jgi:hypothetical protein
MTFVITEKGMWLLKEKTRAEIMTERILKSWSVRLVPTTESAIKHYVISGKLGFRDGTLINNMGDGKIYLISQNKRRQITSPDAFEKYGLEQSEMIWVSADEAKLQPLGEVLS